MYLPGRQCRGSGMFIPDPGSWTYDLYGPPNIMLLMGASALRGQVRYEGKWEGVGPWKSRLGPCEMASSR
jgi:hypothetical protein